MNIRLNGDMFLLPDLPLWTVKALLSHLNVPNKRLAVEINGMVIPKSKHEEQPIAENDVVEIVYAIGGG